MALQITVERPSGTTVDTVINIEVYAAVGNLVWAPDGSTAAATLTDQIASLV